VYALDQVFRHAVNGHRVNLWGLVRQHKAGDVLFVDHCRSDLDAVADLGVELRAPIEQLAVASPYLVMARGEQLAVWLNDLGQSRTYRYRPSGTFAGLCRP